MKSKYEVSVWRHNGYTQNDYVWNQEYLGRWFIIALYTFIKFKCLGFSCTLKWR